MTIEEQIMKLQTYKMYEGEDTVYVERDDVLKALEQQLRDCKTCIHSDKGNCAITEECHECMWESNYEQMPRWIPVSERLPKESGAYLVWMIWGDEEPTYSIINFDADYNEFGEWIEHYDINTLGVIDREFRTYIDVFAWMPLPQPYKAESEVNANDN